MRTAPRAHSRRRVVLATGLGLLLLAAACSEKGNEVSSDDTTAESDETAPPMSVGVDPDGDTTATTMPAVEPKPGGKLVFGGEAEVGNPWTPANVQCDSYCYMRAFAFYDPLTVINDKLEWEPFLAESIEPNDDYTVWTVKMREGIKFHDGTPLNADAVIFNLQQHATSALTGPALQDIARQNPDDPASPFMLKKVDDMTFTISTGKNGNIDEPISWPLLPYGLGKQLGFIASPKWLKDVAAGKADAAKPVGTGPFIVQSYKSGDRLVAKKNPDYWLQDADGNQLPYLDEVEFRVIPDSQVREQAIKTGDVDMIATSDGSVVSSLSEDDKLVTTMQDRLTETAYIMLHVGKPDSPLNSRQVRCALLQGLDRDTLVDQQTDGLFDRADGLFSPGQEGYLEDNGLPEYDPDAAKAAIEDYEAKHGDISIKYSTTAITANRQQAAFVKEQWNAIGVDVDVITVEQSALITNAVLGADDFDAFGWRNHGGIFVDQQNYWWSSRTASPQGQLGLNFGRMRDDVIDEQLEIARTTTDDATRRKAAETINRQFAKECYAISTWTVQWGIVRDPTIEGIGRTPLPDGDGYALDGAGFPGQVWLTAAFRNE